MALTQTTTVDIVNKTQTIVFTSSSTPVEQIQYSSGSMVFGTISSFNLVKSDLILYNQFLQAFNVQLLLNFPTINSSIGGIFPLCNFQISETSVGVTHITYNQTSQGNTVENINYVPVAGSAGFTARASPITITLQEYFLFVLMMGQYIQQVNLN